MKKILTFIFVAVLLTMPLSGCGKDTEEDSVSTETVTEPTVENTESTVETATVQMPEEKNQDREDMDMEIEDKSEHSYDSEFKHQFDSSKTDDIFSEKESESKEITDTAEIEQTETSETTTTPDSVATQEPVIESTPESVLPDCALSDGEWYPPVHMYVIKEGAELHAEPSAESELQWTCDTVGMGFGTTARSGDYIRVNWSAKPSWIHKDYLSIVKP